MAMEDFVDKVFRNIDRVSTSNALKIRDSISFKDGQEGLPCVDFLVEFIEHTANHLDDEGKMKKYCKWILETNKTLGKLSGNGKKESIFDIWILNLRNISREEE